MAYVNLPGLFPKLIDGNLRQSVTDRSPIVLVIGTATQGFTEQLYRVTDVNAALIEYGRTSELGKGILEARDGGATNIFAMRLPGTAPEINRLGAEIGIAATAGFTEGEGYTIVPVLSSIEAGSRYGLAYRHAVNYSSEGAGGAIDSSKVVGELIVVDLETEETVLHVNTERGAIEDKGLISYGSGDVQHTGLTTEEKLTIQCGVKTVNFTVTTGQAGAWQVTIGLASGVTQTVTTAAPASSSVTDNAIAIRSAISSFLVNQGIPLTSITATNTSGAVTVTIAEARKEGFVSLALTSGGAGVAGTPVLSVGADAAGNNTLVISGEILPFTTDAADTPADVADALATAINANTNLASVVTATVITNGKVLISIDSNATANSEGLLVYPSGSARAGRAFRTQLDFQSSPGAAFKAITTGTHFLQDLGIFPVDPTAPFGRRGAGTFVSLNLFAAYMEEFYAQNVQKVFSDTAFTIHPDYGYTEGATGATISLMERYEKLEAVYRVLDFRNFDIVVPQGITLDAKNIADDLDLEYDLSDYPAGGGVRDVLGKLAMEELEDYTYRFVWDTDGDDVGNICNIDEMGDLENGPFHEVNFAHQLARFCFKASENYQFCHGVIGTSLPKSLTPRGILQFFGKLPTYTYDNGTESYVIDSSEDDGTGLLGHKLVGGRNGYNFDAKGGGLPLTKDEFFDTSNSESNLVKDTNNRVVDLGKYISAVAAFGHLRNEFNSSAGGYLTNLANIYAGMLAALPLTSSPTSKPVPSARLRYLLPGNVADAAAGARLVVVKTEGNDSVPEIADAPTFALENSDYTRVATMRIVAKIIEDLRTAYKVYQGEVLQGVKRQSLDTAFQGVLANAQNEQNIINGGSYTLSQTRNEATKGIMQMKLQLRVPTEQRQLIVNVSLSPE